LNSDSKFLNSILQPPCEDLSQGDFFIDAHCHLADSRLDWRKELEEAAAENVQKVISCALSPAEILWHQSHLDPAIAWVAGMHPFYPAGKEITLDAIATLCQKGDICGIGEIGLDGRNGDMETQIKLLLPQLDLARMYGLPVVFHVVRWHYELIRLLKRNFPGVHGIVHGFDSSPEAAEAYSRFNLGFSLGCKSPSAKAVAFITARGLFCVETDTPFQKATDNMKPLNHLNQLPIAIAGITTRSGLSQQAILHRQKATLHSLGFLETS